MTKNKRLIFVFQYIIFVTKITVLRMFFTMNVKKKRSILTVLLHEFIYYQRKLRTENT